MTSIRIRPRFKTESELKSEEIQKVIQDKTKEDNSPCIGVFLPDFITLKIKIQDIHFWSPQLTLSFSEEDGKTLIRGLYGPNPTVWTVIAFGYVATGVLGLFSLFFGLSQWSLDKDPWALWITVVMAVFAVVLYLISQFGQKLGVEQTFRIHQLLEESLGQKIHIT
ncbi:MAG: hypothetical protein JXQ96_13110 [Cyclobacteriaceae bacterium]